ncbi:hypothetical protein AB0D86_26915 [Streptomyces sp. NPDC048324]|uniref:hypothetical protein n=1 Tax=Streptomyces sp. NPDC048324 TaxID=3157205 RepID=UPI00342CF538
MGETLQIRAQGTRTTLVGLAAPATVAGLAVATVPAAAAGLDASDTPRPGAGRAAAVPVLAQHAAQARHS